MASTGVKKKKSGKIKLKDSIKTKLILILLAVAAVPLLIAVGVSYKTSTGKAKKDALDLLESDAKVVEGRFSTIVQQNYIALRTCASAQSTIDYVKSYNKDADGADTLRQRQIILKQMDKINENINDGNSNCILSIPSGDQLIRTDRKDSTNIADREYFQECFTKKVPTVSNIVVSKAAGNRICIIIVPVFDNETGQMIGSLQRSFDLNVLHEFLVENVENGYIVDKAGTVAAHSQFEIAPEDEPIEHTEDEYMTSELESNTYTSIIDGKLTYTSWVREPTTGFVVAVSKTSSEIMSSAIRSALIVVVLGLILLAVAVVISLLMAKSFTEPIAAVNDSLGALADGRFVKVSKYDKRKDEFGAISKATNSVIEKLDEIVSHIKESAENVGTSSGELSDMANQISQTADDVSNAVQEIASGATQQADEIQNASNNVDRIGDAVNDVQTSTGNLSGLADKMKEASEVSSTSLATLRESSIEMTTKIDDIANTIQATQEAVDIISDKVEGITSIATQTNLLSLNASIEAARAGEAGKGFAVVAEEIGKLADDSKAMADEIMKEMTTLLEQSKAAVAAAEDVKNGNNEQQIAIGETLDAVNGMLQDIGSTVDGVKLISQGAETCASSKDAVVDTMSALSAISEENAASSEETGASMEELSATVTSLASSADKLKEIAEELNENMKFFKA
ncbi:MAG: methyl-accepting chemotaxis protein [Butyrivibrio sp.]|nr:methyl-accepting chemotaxis protein [Butyrivibrio sp.]